MEELNSGQGEGEGKGGGHGGVVLGLMFYDQLLDLKVDPVVLLAEQRSIHP